jgi:hypothetical protein
VLEEFLCRQIARLPPIEDRLGDIRRQIAEADERHEIGALPLPLGKCSKPDAFVISPSASVAFEPARPEKQRDNGGSGFAANGSVPSIPILKYFLAWRGEAVPARTESQFRHFKARARLFTPKNRGPDQCAPVIRSAITVSDR